MPTRILREGIITSERINALSFEAELFYRRLMSVADDYGRFFAHPSILRASCYPLKLDSISEKDVKRLLSECVSVGIITLYGSEKYLSIQDFKQQTRAKSKFPDPIDNELLSKCTSGASSNAKQMLSLVVVEDEGGVACGPDKKTKDRAYSQEEVESFFESSGFSKSDAEWFWNKCEGNGWRNGGSKIKDWKATCRSWKSAGYFPSMKNGNGYHKPSEQSRDIGTLKLQ